MPISRGVLRPLPALSSGQRDKLVTIQQLTSSVGATRFPVETWTTLGTAYMSRTESSAMERFVSGQQSASQETVWEMDYQADMDPDLLNVPKSRRLIYQGRTYDITAATTIEPKRGIELLTLARVQT